MRLGRFGEGSLLSWMLRMRGFGRTGCQVAGSNASSAVIIFTGGAVSNAGGRAVFAVGELVRSMVDLSAVGFVAGEDILGCMIFVCQLTLQNPM